MATDQLVLGNIVFDEWMTPEAMPFGGEQAMKVHKLAGGRRVLDILGPDEMDICFRGIIWANNAAGTAATLNAMRIAGDVVALTFGGNFYQVVVKRCILVIRRFPQWYIYDIECVVASNPAAGQQGTTVSSFADLVGADMASALSVVGL